MGSLKSKNEQLIKGTIIYAIGSFGSKILSLLIVPLYTFYIIPEELGDYDLILATVNLLMPLVTLQITDATYKWTVDNFENKKQIFSMSYMVLMISSILFTTIILFIGNQFISGRNAVYLALMLVSQIWFTSVQRILKALKRQKTFALAGIFQTFCFLGLIILTVCGLKLGIDGLCISYIVAHIMGIVFILLNCRELIIFKLKVDGKSLKQMLKFSVPLIPNAMSWWLINSSDKYIIRMILGAASNGIYSVSIKFPAIVQTVNGLFYSSWQDVAIREKSGEERNIFYTNTFRKYYKISFGLVLILIPVTKFILPFIVSKSYSSAALYTNFLYLGMVFQGFSSFYGINYLNESKTMGATFTSLIAAVINLGVDLIFMPYIGLHAAGISTFLGFFCMWLIRGVQTRKITKITVNKKEFCVWFGLSLAMAIICIFANVVICFVLAVLFTVVFMATEKEFILLMKDKIFNKLFYKKESL